jgi:hypothetical protein
VDFRDAIEIVVHVQVSVADWEEHTEYRTGLSAYSPQVRWFWEVLQQWDDGTPAGQRKLADLLQFCTGSRRVPVGGFAQLQVSSMVMAKSSLGDATSSLGDATSSLGDAKSSLGDAKSSLGDTKSSLGGR